MSDGHLSVGFKSSSWFLTESLPVEVRDASNQLVIRGRGHVDAQLPPGLYIVEAALPGGSRHSEVVAVRANTPTEVVLERSKAPSAATIADGPAPAPDADDDLEEDRDGPQGGVMVLPAHREVSSAALLEVQGCRLREEGPSGYAFDAEVDPVDTPTATFEVGATRISVSLPVNPRGQPDERGCWVTFERRAGRIRADVSFDRRRRVAWTLEGLVKADDAVSTAELFRDADDVLFYKYRDPAAAALGGLTLHRIGRLRERSDWVENLARDFEWVADGRVLLSALLAGADQANERDRGLEMLLEVAPRRTLFSDGLALLLRLLRTWPDGSGEDERRRALKAITSDPMTIDWEAMALTKYVED